MSLWPWRLTDRGCLLRIVLHQVSLLEASLVEKVPQLRGLITSQPRSPTSLEPVERLVLLCHAACVALLEEWPIVPRTRCSGRRWGAPEPWMLGGLANAQEVADARGVGGRTDH